MRMRSEYDADEAAYRTIFYSAELRAICRCCCVGAPCNRSDCLEPWPGVDSCQIVRATRGDSCCCLCLSSQGLNFALFFSVFEALISFEFQPELVGAGIDSHQASSRNNKVGSCKWTCCR